jgi:hypothetical protein
MVYETSTRQVGKTADGKTADGKTADGKVESKGDQQAGGVGAAPSVGNVHSAKRSEESMFSHPIYPEFHLVEAPVRNSDPSHPGDNWKKLTGHATQLYEQLRATSGSAVLALGSTKSNPMVELILSRTFLAEAFSDQDDVAKPALRKCPILFRYRDDDPKPPSCCGGLKLAKNTQAPLPGIYFELKDGSWDGFTWDPASSDVAFLAYAYRPNAGQVEVACGGFSARATRCLTRKLQQIIGSLGEPQYISKLLQVGMYLIEITFDPKDTNYSSISDNRDFEFQVIRLDEDVLKRRLEG